MRLLSRCARVPAMLAGMAVCLSAVARPASADWPQFGRGICTAAGSQVHPVIATDGADGAIIAWQDHRDPAANLFAQHVLASGEVDPLWPANGRALLTDPAAAQNEAFGLASPQIVSDGAGGAIVVWEDNRSDVTETDIFAQHVLASGAVDGAWPANGTGLSVIAGLQDVPVVAPDGAGGAIVAWMDTRPGASIVDVYAQHVLASGAVDGAWPVNGLAVSTAAGPQEFPAIVADGSGGAIVTWFDLRDATTGLDVYAQHVLSSGLVDPAWPVNGRAVCTAGGDQGHPSITSDGSHGAIIAWSDSRIVGTSHIFAHHVLGSGTVDPAWPADGRAISAAALSESRPLAVPDGAGGAVVTWQGFTVELNMYAQHVTATGIVDPAWPAGGRALSNSDRQQTHAEIAPDGAGGAVVAWQDDFDIVAHHVLASGALDPEYPAAGRVLCDLPSQQGDPAVVATAGAGAIVTWTDTRGASPDIFAMQVLAAATVSVPGPVTPGLSFARPSPNPARGPLSLRFALPREARVRLAIYDATGRRVRELASGVRPAGEQTVAWDLRDDLGRPVGAGLYFARLEADGRSLMHKLVALE